MKGTAISLSPTCVQYDNLIPNTLRACRQRYFEDYFHLVFYKVSSLMRYLTTSSVGDRGNTSKLTDCWLFMF